MTREEFKARVSMAYGGRDEWEQFLEAVWQLHLQASSQWIPVEEELPPKKDKYSKRSNEVLVITERKECFIAKYLYDGDGWAVNGFPTSKLTHWMPIVPPRKEE